MPCTINVIAPDAITAVATGTPGGAKVTYQEPILDVLQGGKNLGELDAANPSMSIGPLSGPGGLNLGILSLSIGSPTGVTESADGTAASGGISLLHLSVPAAAAGSPIPLPAGVPTVADVEVSPLTASATVPSGGVVCSSTSPGGESEPAQRGAQGPELLGRGSGRLVRLRGGRAQPGHLHSQLREGARHGLGALGKHDHLHGAQRRARCPGSLPRGTTSAPWHPTRRRTCSSR